jgi:hypothetical protein
MQGDWHIDANSFESHAILAILRKRSTTHRFVFGFGPLTIHGCLAGRAPSCMLAAVAQQPQADQLAAKLTFTAQAAWHHLL